MTAADPPPRSGSTPGRPKAPEARYRDQWPGPRPILWAPRAHTVEIVLPRTDGADERRPLRLVGAQEPGYWRADDELALGTRYSFSIDGGTPLPDPCSTSLPAGIDGPSLVLDEDYTWTDAAWRGVDLAHGTLLHLDVASTTERGTLDAAAELLPQIADIGVDGVELAPVAAHDPGAGLSAGVRLFAVHEDYGGAPALHRFVDAAHRHGLAVVMDLPHRWAVADSLGLHAFGPYAVGSRLPPRAGSEISADTPRVNLDGSGSRGARDFLIADARRWLEIYHVDGLLLDVAVLTDRSAAPFLGELLETAQDVGSRSGLPRTLFTDGHGRSDRLTSLVGALLDGELHESATALIRLSEEFLTDSLPLVPGVTPRRARGSQRTAAAVVDDLTRLPAAARTVSWSTAQPPRPAEHGIDDVAALLLVATIAGSPLVLDTEHVPVPARDAGSQRLVDWARILLRLRPSALMDLRAPIDLHVDGRVMVGCRGSSALALNLGDDATEIDLTRHLPAPVAEWQVAASWRYDETHLLAGRLRVPARAGVVLRTDRLSPADAGAAW